MNRILPSPCGGKNDYHPIKYNILLSFEVPMANKGESTTSLASRNNQSQPQMHQKCHRKPQKTIITTNSRIWSGAQPLSRISRKASEDDDRYRTEKRASTNSRRTRFQYYGDEGCMCPHENTNCCMARLLSKRDDFVDQISMLETVIRE